MNKMKNNQNMKNKSESQDKLGIQKREKLGNVRKYEPLGQFGNKQKKLPEKSIKNIKELGKSEEKRNKIKYKISRKRFGHN